MIIITGMVVVPILVFTLGIWSIATKPKDPPTRCQHDWNMDFPNNDLNWMFICKKCGRTTTHMEETLL